MLLSYLKSIGYSDSVVQRCNEMLDTPPNGWEDAYKVVTVMRDNTISLLSREVFYAKLGVILGAGSDKCCIPDVMRYADIETIHYLISHSTQRFLKDSVETPLDNAVRRRRQDVCLLLLKNSSISDDANIVDAINSTLEFGCDQVFWYLVAKYPDLLPRKLGKYYLFACAYGFVDIANMIAELRNIKMNKLQIGKNMLQLSEGYCISAKQIGSHVCSIIQILVSRGLLQLAYRLTSEVGHYIDELPIQPIWRYEPFVASGFIPSSKDPNKLCRNLNAALTSSRIVTNILAALNCGYIIAFDDLLPFIQDGYIAAQKMLAALVMQRNIDLELIRQLSRLLPLLQKQEIVSVASKYGNWQYISVILDRK